MLRIVPEVPLSTSLSAPSDATPAQLREITASIQALKGEAAAVLYQLGALLRQVDERELWRAGGFSSLTDYLEREVDVAPTTARRAIQVARHFNLEIATRYGFDKLSKGLRYMELTRAVEQPGDLIAADLRIRGAGGRFRTVPFHTATARQIEDAIQIEVERQRAAAHRTSSDVATRLRALSQALPAVPTGARPAKSRVEATKTRQGDLMLTFKQIPMAELRAFLDAVERELLGEIEGEIEG